MVSFVLYISFNFSSIFIPSITLSDNEFILSFNELYFDSKFDIFSFNVSFVSLFFCIKFLSKFFTSCKISSLKYKISIFIDSGFLSIIPSFSFFEFEFLLIFFESTSI